mmetsp:Transcript_15586/g.33973  ORF Transcript_15586/g.33973 Transcript_15586/m.33973 type:complete len:416 (-) Transcript_15586:252-1499(-)
MRVLAPTLVLAAGRPDGLATTPPMGWRSWNGFHGSITQEILQAQVDGLVRKVKGTSLLDLGYGRVGLDDYWQDCGAGINGSFHDAQGHPLINTTAFPNLTAFNSYAHSKGVLTGWYMNNCHCKEEGELEPNWAPQMEGDTAAIAAMGWDGVKIDGCGPSHDTQLWSDLLNKTGRQTLIENCGNNKTFPYVDAEGVLQCPHHMWRISTDIEAKWDSVVNNLQMLLHERTPGMAEWQLSQPGCWAYPDMLEVGLAPLTHTESRSHFGLWAVTSSPLILSLDLGNEAAVSAVWDIIANEEALAVNQDYAGLSTKLISQCVREMGCTVPVGLPAQWQIWGKPIANRSKWAVVAVNMGDTPVDFEVDFDTIGGLGPEVHARDVWAHKNLGKFSMNFPIDQLAPHDSKFLILTGDPDSVVV